MLYKLKYINERGESIEFKGNQYDFQEPIEFKNKTTNPFNLIRFEGFGEVGADVQLQKAPFQDGSTHIDTRLQERNPYLEFVIVSDDWSNLSNYRKYVSSVFNPKINGRFELSFDNKTYVLDSIPESVPFFADEDTVGRSQVVSVNLICPNPYWKSPTIEEQPTFEPLFQFPFEGAFQMGIQRDLRIINNDSDTEVPIQVEFYGPAINPIITNKTTGEFIKVNQTLQENEYMRIDTTEGKKSVVFINVETGEERNVFNWIDLGSTFFQLQIGENAIEYSADNDIQGAIVNIYWQKHFVGV
ncbi:phage tail domain-containing protein [Caldifermentibacillus hisashii]|uniref:phage distal tail protein n=1 Tax=Caldifermentibacillus hisashii TaxID=996558 RepID=UPI0031FD1C66